MAEEKIFEPLIINPEKVSDKIIDFLRERVNKDGKDGIAFGLSGGVDSSTLAMLAVKAVGPLNVDALYLPGKNSESKFAKYAQEVADLTGIYFETREIDAAMEKLGIYKPGLMKIIPFSALLNKIIISVSRNIFPLIFGESFFTLTLQRKKFASGRFFGKIYNLMAETVEKSFNAQHIHRRKILEQYSKEKNLLLVGAANKSEAFVGWFVKDGIDDLPIEALLGLYKTQIYQLARFLKVPEKILAEKPSPDMLKGIGDENFIGYPYAKIDIVAYIIERGLNPQIAFDNGINPEEFEGIKRLNRLSAWKRGVSYEFPEIE